MKPLKYILFSLLWFYFTGCENGNDVPAEVQEIVFLTTEAGGCNNQDFNDLKSSSFENDTIYFSSQNDTLTIFTGLNYLCCAPFETSALTLNDTIFILIEDTCTEPYSNCYCKCICYYTWNFRFTGLTEKRFWLKIELNDPRQKEPIVITDGNIAL
jgi:hypothetical protein